MFHGESAFWYCVGEIKPEVVEPPRPLTERGLLNLTAFAKLYGYVRFFHPADQAAGTDWDTFAIEGARSVEDAAGDAELAARLGRLFQPIAQTVQVAEGNDHQVAARVWVAVHHDKGALPFADDQFLTPQGIPA